MTASRFLLAALASILTLTACAPEVSIRPLTSAQIEQARGANRTLVLLQIETLIDGKPVAPTSAIDSNRALRLYVARMDSGETPARVFAAALSEESAAAGWRYLLLEPGRYFLLILPPGVEQNPPAVAYHAPSGKFGRLTQYRFLPGRGGTWIPELMAFMLPGIPPEDFRPLPGFWLEVPAAQPVLYAGSLRVACTDGRGLGGLIDSCTEFERRDDMVEAQRIAGMVPSLGAPHAAPLIVYGTRSERLAARDIGAPTIEMAGWKSLGAVYPGAQLAPWGVIHGSERPVLVFNLLAITAHAIGQAATAKEAERRSEAARACMERLSSSLPHIDGETDFGRTLRAALRPGAVATGVVQPRISVTPTLLRLRESTVPDHLALELGLHVRLQAGQPPSTVYESRLVYAEPFPRENPLDHSTRLYERLTAQLPAVYPLAQWCGPEGSTLLEREIRRGIEAIAAQVARDLE